MKVFSSLYLCHSRIQSKQRLRAALKHNRRELNMRGPSHANIDQTKSDQNFSVFQGEPTAKAIDDLYVALEQYEVNKKKAVRKDAILAIEIVFSIPASRTDIDIQQYFAEAFDWACKSYTPLRPLSAEVHLDEAHPHLHVIFSCIEPDRLLGSRLYASPNENRKREKDFEVRVGLKYNIRLRQKLRKAEKSVVVQDVMAALTDKCDPILQSQLLPLMRTFVEQDPWLFAEILGVEVKVSPPAERTFTQIMTSKGKGKGKTSEDED